MSSAIRKASRSSIPLKIGVMGISGSGKTYSALRLAHGLCGSPDKIVVIDSETTGTVEESENEYENRKRGADFYDDILGQEFSVLPVEPPFTPQKYVKAINLCVKEGFEVIIIDSATHVWEGPGGVLDIHHDLGGQFNHWKQANTHHNSFIGAIMNCPVHLICTVRMKKKHEVSRNDKGKHQITKLGEKAIQRDGFEYDLHVVFDVDKQTHKVSIDKDRTGVFEGRAPFLITKETGEELKTWNSKKTETKESKKKEKSEKNTSGKEKNNTQANITDH